MDLFSSFVILSQQYYLRILLEIFRDKNTSYKVCSILLVGLLVNQGIFEQNRNNYFTNY